MSTTSSRTTGVPRNGAEPAKGLAAASLGESLGVLATGVVPSLLRGLFAPRKRAMKLLTALDTDRRTVERLSAIRRRHPGEGVRLLGGRLVVLWGPSAIREVLDRSAYEYASDSGAKGKGMAHFQPDALTLSRGEDWEDRRKFTEAVLATSERVHPFAERFLAVVADEAEQLHVSGDLSWLQLGELFDHITLRVIFGDRARGDQHLTMLLEKRMREANRLVVASNDDELFELHGRLEGYVREAEEGSLVARFADAPQSDRTRVVHQIPHWMFATRDTLAMNVARALAVIASDAGVEQKARDELDGADPSSPEGIDGLRYLEGCLQEAMRLWPTTPLLARETTQEVTIAGEKVDEGAQVLMLNVFNHRNTVDVPDADEFRPGRWAAGTHDYRFNHLSNGSQDCPGGPLVLLLGKAVLAQLLDRYELDLREPDLDLSGSVPHMLDFFALRFAARPHPDAS
jgi:cytochrome P450